MSDSIKDLAKSYDDYVYGGHPRSIGLFPIPEYPEYEARRGMWSAALDAILTTLRYLAPATLLTLFWGQQSFLFKLLKSIDSAFRAIVFSSEEQKEEILQWISEAGAVQVENLNTVWRHGWILCGVLDAALPGACAGHPPTRLTLKHALAIADHYLGVEPVFSRQELETCDSLSRHQEWKLATYLDRIRQALSKLTPPVSKPNSQRTSPETSQFTLDYVARGSGLTAAQVNSPMHFKIYPTSQQYLDPGELTILIRGPKDTYGMITIPPILGKAQLIRQRLLGLQPKQNFTENALPITQGATYLRSYGKNYMNKTYHIPKTKYDIEIEGETQADHTKITYMVALEGRYEISITSRGHNIAGSPFSMTASYNIIQILERESFCLEDGEEIDIVDVKTDRKVVLRIVDFVTEKMLLKENGSLEKITDDEAQILMSTDNFPNEYSEIDSRTSSVTPTASDDFQVKSDKFNKVANKVVQMNRVCKIINTLLSEKKFKAKSKRSRSQQDIPDIVNSTFGDTNVNPFLSEKRDKYIIPENISVSLRTEKAKQHYETEMKLENTAMEGKSTLNDNVEDTSLDSLDKYESLQDDDPFEGVLKDRPNSSSNPFLNEIYDQNFVMEKDLGSFVKTEYETNKSDNEETEFIKILVENLDGTPSPTNTNPFIEPDIILMERPKTPVLKIITGEVKGRDGSVYLDPRNELISEEMLSNEFVNPFFIHHHHSNQNDPVPITDFIIGAPVSMPPIVRAPTPEPEMESLLITENEKKKNEIKKNVKDKNDAKRPDEEPSSTFSTPIHTTLSKLKDSQRSEINCSSSSSTFYSLDSNSDSVEIVNLPNISDIQVPSVQLQSQSEETPKKDMWDSAYVSIDDNSSPESNDPTYETLSKQKFSLSDTSHEYANMGPAEREIWKTCDELNDTKICEEIKSKWDVKRPLFTPILEESDRSMSTGLKDITRSETASSPEHQAVTVAFAELKDMNSDSFPNGVNDSTTFNQNIIQLKRHLDYANKSNEASVNSASVVSDVKRHAKESEGKISEVQANVTESVSVSQTLQRYENGHSKFNEHNNETQFGDTNNTNIVLEKKQYWDNRIREIQAKSSEEGTTLQKRRRLSARHLRQNDSLTKRRGQQLANNINNEKEKRTSNKKSANKDVEIVNRKSPISHDSPDQMQTDVKLVEKWKKYWDSKLEISNDETDTSCFRTKSPKNKATTRSIQKYNSDDLIEVYNEDLDDEKKTLSLPVKQELPEEVFKAFETSPKRFFGTSRKQILNKIDTFLGKPNTADESSPDHSGASTEYDTGLVSSRISLFHNISQTEELELTRRKCQSMHNIFQRKDSEKSFISTSEIEDKKLDKPSTGKLSYMNKTFASQDPKDSENEPVNIALKDKRARLVQNIYNKSFDESVHKKPLKWNTVQVQDANVRNAVKEHNIQNYPPKKYSQNIDLRKLSMSKSEMDIFTKITNKPVEDDLDKYKSCDELPKISVKNFINLYENVSKTEVKIPVRRISRTKSLGLQRNSSSSSSTGAVNNFIHKSFTTKRERPSSETDESSTDLTPSPVNYWNKDPETISTSSCEPKSLDSIDIDIVTKNSEKQTTYLSLSDMELEIVENAEKPDHFVKQEDAKEIAPTDYKSRFKMAKDFFKSLEELRDVKKPKKLNECELLLIDKSTESLDKDRPQRRVKKNIKSHSMPSSEISKIWTQLQEIQSDSNNGKLVKISEKFNVEDLFSDVMEGKLSRQGSLRGIPHKKAVLEAFRSMENLTDNKFSSYEIATSQLNDFAKDNQIKNAQTYLTEYPYLPTTDPSKYHSRLDTKASGLITLKELHSQRPRRNSVPDLRLNPSFTVEL